GGGGDGGSCRGGGGGGGGGASRALFDRTGGAALGGGGSGGAGVNVFEIEAGNVLRLAVLEQGYLGGLEVGDGIAVFVARGEVDQDDFGGGLEGVDLRLGRLDCLLRYGHGHEPDQTGRQGD